MRRRSSAGATPLKTSRRKTVRAKRRNTPKVARRLDMLVPARALLLGLVPSLSTSLCALLSRRR